MVNEQALLTDLVDAINAWTEGSRSRSLSGLARRTGVAYSTIRRIAQNESVPHPYTALAISEVVMTTLQRLEFLKKHFPTIGNLMEECYPTKLEAEPNGEALKKFLSMEPHNRIFNIAATVRGTTRRAIQSLCGQVGSDSLDEMLDAGLLVELNDGTIKYTNDSWTQSNVEDALQQIRHSTEHFDKNLIGTEGASLMHSTGSIKPERIPEVKALVLKFIKDLSALKNDEESVGDIHFFCDLMYSLYDRQEWAPNEERN
ncbi:MAG: XRE family transcriptional regulator [Proteobacteria bacterium]|nr:MAG: XRE family transcriptional regulator [Pseudomonadota bacterium]